MQRLLYVILCSWLLSVSLYSGFVQGTLVKVPGGYKPIEELVVGDDVCSVDIDGQLQTSMIVGKIAYKSLRGIGCSIAGESIRSASLQPYYAADQTWQLAKKLEPKLGLYSPTYNHLMLDQVSQLFFNNYVTYVDIQLKDIHTFCVTEHDIVVHNFPPVAIGIAFAFGNGIVFESVTFSFCVAGTWIGSRLLRRHKDKKLKAQLLLGDEQSQQVLGEVVSDNGASPELYGDHVIVFDETVSALNQADYIGSGMIGEKSKKPTMKDIQEQVKQDSGVAAGGAPDPDDEEFKKKYPNGIYEENPKHHQNSRGGISKPPRDGQALLNESVPVRGNANRRVSIQDGKAVVFELHRPGRYHGYVVEEFNSLRRAIKNTLYETGLINNISKGK